jgi:hypothetical protein
MKGKLFELSIAAGIVHIAGMYINNPLRAPTIDPRMRL